MWRQLSRSEKFQFVVAVMGLAVAVLLFIVLAINHQPHWVRGVVWPVCLLFVCIAQLNKLVARGRGTGAPQTDTTETRPVSRVKANEGYFKKCAACGKFTRDAKVCRNCGRDLTDRAPRRLRRTRSPRT
jgi:uncharacterized protein (DUF983 family)